MAYDSQLEVIKYKVFVEGSPHRRDVTLESFTTRCQKFMAAGTYPYPAHSASEVQKYPAEKRMWSHYLPEALNFPGIDPTIPNQRLSAFSPRNTHQMSGSSSLVPYQVFGLAIHLPRNNAVQQTPEASGMKKCIQRMRASRSTTKIHQSKFLGWNPTTGEPWLAVRCYAENAYPALCRPNQKFLREVQAMEPAFVVQFERFYDPDYLLMWPEFANDRDLEDLYAWRKFGEFRVFLTGWASTRKGVMDFQEGYRLFRASLAAKQGLPLPDGFDIKRYIRNHNIAARDRKTLYGGARSHRGQRRQAGHSHRELAGEKVDYVYSKVEI